MKLSVLVGFRDTGDGHRTRLWDVIRGMLEERLPEAELVVGDDGGEDPFWKTKALNDAASRATGDVFMLTDTDTWVSDDCIRATAAGIEHLPRYWWRPWNVKYKLGQAPTEQALAGGWDGSVIPGGLENTNRYWAAPPILMHSDLWFEAGGQDDRFRGWGHEDDAFASTLKTLFGEPVVIPGPSVHLWHPRIGKSGRDLWVGQESAIDNRVLAGRYKTARTRERIMELIASRGQE